MTCHCWKTCLGAAALIASTAAVTTTVVSQDRGSTAAPTMEKPAMMDDESMAKWMEYGQPGEHHEKMNDMIGTWNSDITMWMAPDTPPQKTTGEVTYKWILDGHYVQGHYNMMMMGMPFKGMEVSGYDNYRGEYFSMWFDSMGTSYMLTKGDWNDDQNKLLMKGSYDDVVMDKKNQPVRTVATHLADDKMMFEMFTTAPDGKEFQNMKIVSTKVN